MAALEEVRSSTRPLLLCLLALLLLPDLAWASRDWDDSEGLALLANETQGQALGAPERQPLEADYKNEKRAGSPELQGEAAAADPKDLAVVVHALGRMQEAKAHGMPLPASAFVRTLAVASAGSGDFELSILDMFSSALKSFQTYFDVGGTGTGIMSVATKVPKIGSAAGALTFFSIGGLVASGASLAEGIWDYQEHSKGNNTCLKRVAGFDIAVSIGGIATGVVGIACPVVRLVGAVGAGLSLIWDVVKEGIKQWCKSNVTEDDATVIVNEKKMDEQKLDEEQKKSLRKLGTKGIEKEMGEVATARLACTVDEFHWDRKKTREMFGDKLPAPQKPKQNPEPLPCNKKPLPKITFTYGACPWAKGNKP